MVYTMERVNETMLEEPSTYTYSRYVSHSLILDSGSIESTYSFMVPSLDLIRFWAFESQSRASEVCYLPG